MKKVLVVGYKGNMGQRYCRILDFLKISWVGYEINYGFCPTADVGNVDGIIIATPTGWHPYNIKEYNERYHEPILCEKPICKDIEELKDLLAIPGLSLRMVNQYEYMPGADEADAEGKSYYNYFKTGQDSLGWDCINIIGLANGEVELKNNSPVWDCWINGKSLNIYDMDHAYIEMIEDWVNNPTNNHDYILKAHKDVIKWTAQ